MNLNIFVASPVLASPLLVLEPPDTAHPVTSTSVRESPITTLTNFIGHIIQANPPVIFNREF